MALPLPLGDIPSSIDSPVGVSCCIIEVMLTNVFLPWQPLQVYMDWANHYLRKSGHSATLSDLKDISDGHFLPQIIQAVGKRGGIRMR